MTRHVLAHRRRYDAWQEVLPGVFLAHAGELTRRQMMLAALLWAGPHSAIDGVDACRFHGVRCVTGDDDVVHVVVPSGSGARDTGFVRVRRTSSPIFVVHSRLLRFVEPAAAVVAATRMMRHDRAIVAAFSEAVQRRVCTPEQLMRAHVAGPRRNAQAADEALAAVVAGVRSVPEGTFRMLAEASSSLPPLLYNPLLRLPCGRRISPDALAVDAGLVHETNGAGPHRRDDLFEDMQERHDVMTVAGLTVLHNSPRRLWSRGRVVIEEFERCHARLRGRGLPPDVLLLRPGPG